MQSLSRSSSESNRYLRGEVGGVSMGADNPPRRIEADAP
jgi:hypothetical protein